MKKGRTWCENEKYFTSHYFYSDSYSMEGRRGEGRERERGHMPAHERREEGLRRPAYYLLAASRLREGNSCLSASHSVPAHCTPIFWKGSISFVSPCIPPLRGKEDSTMRNSGQALTMKEEG